MKRFSQEECVEGGSDDFLGTSVGFNWVHDKESKSFLRLHTSELDKNASREDL